jgi:hypothetical protein
MQVKHIIEVYSGTPWQCRLRRHFREWEVVERVDLKIDGMYHMQHSLHHRKYILYFYGTSSTVSTSRRVSGWPLERRQVSSWWHYRVLFCKRDQYLVLLYTSNPSRRVNTNCHSPIPCPLPFTMLGSYAVSAELHGVTLTTVIPVLNTLSSFTPTADQHLHRQNHVVT